MDPTWVIAYDTLLVASTETDEDAVYRMTLALFLNWEQLVAASPAFRLFSPDAMAKDHLRVEYHAGTIRFYREQGLWPP